MKRSLGDLNAHFANRAGIAGNVFAIADLNLSATTLLLEMAKGCASEYYAREALSRAKTLELKLQRSKTDGRRE
ncbi:MAG: hypothetical protein ACU84Q_02350 [Gammaproteobacteria bacterium]